MTTWLLIDCPNLLHRAYHACGPLTHKEMPTGALYGFFRDVLRLRRLYATDDIVFAFDHGESLRKKIYPQYKGNRLRNAPPVCNFYERAGRKELARQMDHLKWELLPRCLGYPNVFHEEGYEADDVIAQVCKVQGLVGDAVVVSNDRDLYQLLHERVRVWRPGKGGGEYTEGDFLREYGFAPQKVVMLKALCGDQSDNIKGLPGVGRVSATQYIRGDKVVLKKAARSLHSEECKVLRDRNLKLTTLPYPGCPSFQIKRRAVPCPDKAWREVLHRLGMKSLEV